MKKNRNHIKILIANLLRTLLVFFIVIGIWIGILYIKESDFFQFYNVLIFIFLAIIVYCVMDIWKIWIIQEKCDFQAQETYILKLLNQKRYKEHIGLHLELLHTSLILGKYDQSKQEIDKLNEWNSRLNNMQRFQLQLCNIDCMISMNKTASLKKELEKAEIALNKLHRVNNKTKQNIQTSIRLRRYLIEEKWEEILKLLKDISKVSKNATIYEQIYIAYIQGKCDCELKNYKEAFEELRFVINYGGNTKYVKLANNLLEKMPEKNLPENIYAKKYIKIKHGMGRKIIFLIISCFLVLLFSIVTYWWSQGKSVEEAYSKRYLCAENELTIYYQKNIGDYKLVILNEDEKIAYCLFKETGESNYKIVDSFRIDKNVDNNQMELMETESEKEFYQENKIKQEFWAVLTQFYKKNTIFKQENLAYVGITTSSMAENVTINGNPVSIEQITGVNNQSIYLWRVENIDLKTNIQVEYEKQ